MLVVVSAFIPRPSVLLMADELSIFFFIVYLLDCVFGYRTSGKII